MPLPAALPLFATGLGAMGLIGCYVGLTRKRRLGRRLKEHLTDRHAKERDRFSWFGFFRVLKSKDEDGLRRIGPMASTKPASLEAMIADIEALLIKSKTEKC